MTLELLITMPPLQMPLKQLTMEMLQPIPPLLNQLPLKPIFLEFLVKIIQSFLKYQKVA